MRYVVMGAGAIGAVVGARLHAAGRPVVLVARGSHLATMRRDGLRLEAPDGPERHHVPAVGDPAEADLAPDDVVLLAVKSQDTDAALDQLVAAAPPGVAIVCAQNGVANEAKALRRFRAVYGMCVILPSQFTTPGVVHQFSAPVAGVLDLGCFPAGVDERCHAVADDLRAASFASRPDPAIMAAKHRKLLMNLGNAIDALCGAGARRSALFEQAAAEAHRCFEAAGIAVQSEADEHARRAEGVRLLPAGGITHGGSSSWQSLERGTGSIETDYLNGEIVLLGRLHGVATPVNEALQRLATEAARSRRPAGTVPAQEVELLVRDLAGSE
jgi:2-dehydropantoate 2-reductase